MATTNDDLHTFVRDALGRGIPRLEVQAVLTAAGWSAPQAAAAVGEYADVAFPLPVPRPRASLDARDAFLYFVVFTTLYISAFHLGSLTFDFINKLVPDPASPAVSPYVQSAIRWSIASLIIAAPVFLFASFRTRRAIKADSAKRGSKVRRWLIYLTLSIAAAVLIGDFITLVYNLLSGELTTRIFLKVLTVATIAGGVFGYYRWDVGADEKGVSS
jgi:hypothetical protein